MPPPPPPAPPPPPQFSSNSGPSLKSCSSSVINSDRNALLSQIRQGAQLKKTTTNDRSSPLSSGKNTLSTKSNSTNIESSKSKSSNDGPLALGDLFAQGIPKLKHTNKSFLEGGTYKSQLNPRGGPQKNAFNTPLGNSLSRSINKISNYESNSNENKNQKSVSSKCVEDNNYSNVNNNTFPITVEISKGDKTKVSTTMLVPPPPPLAHKKPTFVNTSAAKLNPVKSYLHNHDLPSNSPAAFSVTETDACAVKTNAPPAPPSATRKPSAEKLLNNNSNTHMDSLIGTQNDNDVKISVIPPPPPPPSDRKPSFNSLQEKLATRYLHADNKSKVLGESNVEQKFEKPIQMIDKAASNIILSSGKPGLKPRSFEDSDIPKTFKGYNGKLDESLKGLCLNSSSIPSNLNSLPNSPMPPRLPPHRKGRPVKPNIPPPPLPTSAFGQQSGGSLTDIRHSGTTVDTSSSAYSSKTLPRPPPPPPPPRITSQSATLGRKQAHKIAIQNELSVSHFDSGDNSFENRFASRYRKITELPRPDIFLNKSKVYPSVGANQMSRGRRRARQPPPPPAPAPPHPPPPPPVPIM